MQDADSTEPDQTPQELRRLAGVAAAVVTLGLATYLLPGTGRVQPWVGKEGVPILRMYMDGTEALPGFAEAAMVGSDGVSDARVEKQLGRGVAQNLHAAPAPGGPAQSGTGPASGITPEELAGLTQPIENPEALKTFFAALARTLAREPGAITRVAHYGDSAVAADSITSTARRNFQQRFGDAGHGFILIARGTTHYYHKDIAHRSSDGWEVRSLVMGDLRPGHYGYGGIQTRGRAGDYSYFGTVEDGKVGQRVSSFELFYQRFRGAGSLELKVDGKKHGVLETRSDKVEDAFERIELPDGPHSLSIRALGAEVRLYGVALERSGPGVVYDSLGLVGARADRLLYAEPEHMRGQLAHRKPDLLVLSFGGNESANAWLNPAQYERDLTEVVRHMRSGRPEMSCLLFGPLDQGERDERGKVVTVKVLPKIVDVQRRVAKAEGCAFFDAFAAMGGSGAMAQWIKSRPRLATSDLRHATPAGYEVIGNMYYKAVLAAFASTRGGSLPK